MSGRLVYESTVTAVGGLVQQTIDHQILILFGDGAPEELHDLSVLHRPTLTDAAPQPGDTLRVGGQSWQVLAVGHVVEANLLNLGHLDLKANGKQSADLPGDVCVAAGPITLPRIGDVITVSRADDTATA